METETHAADRQIWFGLSLVTGLLLLVFLLAALQMYRGAAKPLPVYGTISDFALTNQNGHAVSLDDLRGKVWVADIIFTRCPGPCLQMTRQMRALQDALRANGATRLVTLTSDPEFDGPSVLNHYARRFGADSGRWFFLTGTKQEIANLATGSLKLTAVEKKPEERDSPNDLFIHSTIFVLVDKEARLRGIYETTGEGIDPTQVKSELLEGVRRLERE
jgi:protein SCO1/2